MPAGGGQQQVAALGTVEAGFVEHAPGARVPSRAAPGLAEGQETKPQPEGGTRRGRGVARREVRLMGALERLQELRVASEKPRRYRQPVEIFRRERLGAVGRGERLKGRREVPTRIGFPPARERRHGRSASRGVSAVQACRVYCHRSVPGSPLAEHDGDLVLAAVVGKRDLASVDRPAVE